MKHSILVLIAILLITSCSKNSSVSNSSNSIGQGGSMARFTIANNHLYTVDGEYLSVFDISNTATPLFKNKIQIGFNIEAVFPFKDKLFIASNSAMYIYSIANPSSPSQESQVQHLTGCDPVVANDSVAYLTIHGGNQCGSTINQLQVYDIKNINYPQLVQSINLTNPMGLGMSGNTLYVCDNGTGLKVYDITDPYNPILKSTLTGENFIDVILMDTPTMETYMICMLTNGVAYYNVTNPNQIIKLGTVKN
jgi:hypothetical protein